MISIDYGKNGLHPGTELSENYKKSMRVKKSNSQTVPGRTA